MRNIAKQKLDDNDDLKGCFGHEMWAPDGKGLYYVMYICSPDGNLGICYVDSQSGKYKLLYNKYMYWHVGTAPVGKALCADKNNPDGTEVIVIDLEDGSENIIDRPKITGVHPCHPHPSISPDGKRLFITQ